ncbi:MAG TPA: serine/threonine-protein kinase [Kofleriaceae bacterium]|nr:serine/threonine-protein kinase [Kofleriaceae bacterium]
MAGESTTVTVPDVPDAVQTVRALPPAAAERRIAARTHGSSEYTLATLRDEDVRTARLIIGVGRWIGVAAVLALPLVGGAPAMQLVFAATVTFAIVVGVVVELRIRDPARYRELTMQVLAISVAPAVVCGVLYWGIFSAVELFPVLTIYFFSRRSGFGTSVAIYLAAAIVEALVAGLVIGGVIPDPGVFEPVLPRATLVIGEILIQLGLFAAFMLGWLSLRASRIAIDNMQRALVLATRREALLDEARQELERAMRVGGPGRYTDHTFGGFRLGHVIGRGGMGEVYEASHGETAEPAAVKLLPLRELGNPHAVERFVREVRAVSALRSPHVVRVLGASAEQDPIPYLVMERLHGQTLAQLLRNTRPPPHDLIEMLGELGSGLEEAWALGIVHRDLKPHNVFRTDAGWKVLDFGVAALSDRAGTLTQGHVVGTPAYMAPEQARGERVDHRADLYALGAIAYRWLTGSPVCSGSQLVQVVEVAPARPSSLAELDPDVDAALAIGLAIEPAARFTTARELTSALADALAGRLDPELRTRGAGVARWRA